MEAGGLQGRPALAIEQMIALKEYASEFLDSQFGRAEVNEALDRNPGNTLERVSATFLSDTIVLAVALRQYDNMPAPEIGASINSVGVVWESCGPTRH
jgi:hypothetical protein